MKNLSTKLDNPILITHQTKFKPQLLKENIHFPSEFVQHREIGNFGAEYIKYPHSLEILIFELVLKRNNKFSS